MFSFLNPWLLWALPAALSPIIIHLLFLRRAKVVAFGDLTLLRAAYLRSLSASRLRQWLLLLVRCLVLALLALAFARPVLHSSSGAGGAETVNLVVLRDVSYSMGYRTAGRSRFELAGAAGEAAIRSLRASDRVAVATFDDRLEQKLEWAASLDSAVTALKAGALGSRTTNTASALREAYEFLRKAPPASRRAILLLSDNAAHGWRAPAGSFAEAVTNADPAVALMSVDWPDRPDNAAIQTVELGQGSSGRRLAVKTALFGEPRSDWELALWLKEKRSDVRHLALSGPAQADFTLAAADSAAQWGRLELRPDGLPADDAYYFSFWAEARAKVLLVYGSSRFSDPGRSGFFLKKLFGESSAALPFDLEIADSVRARSLDLSSFRAVLLVDFKTVPPDLGGRLEAYVRQGGGLWLFPSRATKPGDKSLASILPGVLGDAFDAPSSGVGADPALLNQPAAARVGWKDLELSRVAVRRRYALSPKTGSQVWLYDSPRRPLLVAGAAGKGHVLVSATPLDLDWTNLALKPAFAPVLDVALSYLASFSKRTQWRTVSVGEPIVRSWTAQEAAPGSVRVRTPDNRYITVAVNNRTATFEPRVPGLYFLNEEAYAVNLDRSTSESDLRTLPNPPWRALRPGDNLQSDFLQALYGRELRRELLLAVFLLLLLETLLGAANRGPAGPHVGGKRRGDLLEQVLR